jgi:hypothetical protein
VSREAIRTKASDHRQNLGHDERRNDAIFTDISVVVTYRDRGYATP